jgi:hypothetical protein
MTTQDYDTLLALLNKLEHAQVSTTIARLARALFQKIARERYSTASI